MADVRSGPKVPITHGELTGWGRTAPTAADIAHPVTDREVEQVLSAIGPRGAIARGMGRSYGDAAQRAGGTVLDMTGDDSFSLDAATGLVTARAGVTLDRLIRHLVPRGWFIPVSPGTRIVTVGGAVGADVHGKNHHIDGSWCNHVRSMQMILTGGDVVTVSPERDADLFWATAGGLGLTGVVTEVTFQAKPVESCLLLVDTDRTDDLDQVIDLMIEGDAAYDYSVAWTDLLGSKKSIGRSVLTRGRFASAKESGLASPLDYRASELATAPRVPTSALLNRWTVKAFNEFWYRMAPKSRKEELQTIPTFWHPLDIVRSWNRLYGPLGFIQWQMAVPDSATETLRTICRRFNSEHTPSFLTVLKRFGPGNPGPLSFPMAGWTLALDIPAGTKDLGRLLDEMDDLVVEAGGRLYLAKDSRLRPELLPAMYPRLHEWAAVKERVDPKGLMCSDLGHRLRLCGCL